MCHRGRFLYLPYHLQSFFEENELEYEAPDCLFRRELYSYGKSRAFINDSPASLAVIKSLGNRLIDVHSQHRNLLLTETHFQLNIVDILAKTAKPLSVYRKEYGNYTAICQSLADLQETASNTKKEEGYLRFQYDELKAANLLAGEQEALEQELDMLTHAEEIKTTLFKVTDILNGENQSVVGLLSEACKTFEQIAAYYPKAGGYTGRLRTAYYDLKDMASETNILKDDIELNVGRLSWVNERINMLYDLQQKHKVQTVEQLILLREQLGAQLAQIDSFDEAIEQLFQKKQASYQELIRMASEITTLRQQSAKTIEKQITAQMILLGVPNTRFQIVFTAKPAPAADGMDDVNFLFAANKNEQLKPVAQTASGGEISRLMLCVKSMIAGHSALPSILFDEIDAGVSGEIADKMAGIMLDLGTKMQVITITHLPQIAAKGKAHYFVYKEDTQDRTLTHIRYLNDLERIDEIARLLSGSEKTQAAVENAKVLLKKI